MSGVATAEAHARAPTRKDFQGADEVRWCPGCGDYAILAQFQKMLVTIGARKEDHVIVSGIGCSSRFPYYVDCYGLHGIHGRAPAIATGVKLANPELTVWVVTGDGDGLSIGAGHLLHALRRNVDIKVLLFNNRIYGLTKGQFSPTSPAGLATRSSPHGNPDQPVNPLDFALGAGASFAARAMDTDTARLHDILVAAARHRGSVFVEILQNCPIFHDGAFAHLKDPGRRLWLEEGRPMRFEGGALGLGDDGRLAVFTADDHAAAVHHPADREMARRLAAIDGSGALPWPLGIVYRTARPAHHEALASGRPRAPGGEWIRRRLGAHGASCQAAGCTTALGRE